MKRVPRRVQDKLYLSARSVHEVVLDEVARFATTATTRSKAAAKDSARYRSTPFWRAIYTVENDTASVQFVSVNEVIPHKY